MICPCGNICEHVHCVFCNQPMKANPPEVKLAEFVANFGRAPTEEEMNQGTCCDDCYKEVLEMDRAVRN